MRVRETTAFRALVASLPYLVLTFASGASMFLPVPWFNVLESKFGVDHGKMLLVESAFTASYGVGLVLWGFVSKRHFRATAFFIGAVVAGLFYALSLANSFFVYLILRCALGLFVSAAYPLASVGIGRSFSPSERTRAFTLVIYADGLGAGSVLAFWAVGAAVSDPSKLGALASVGAVKRALECLSWLSALSQWVWFARLYASLVVAGLVVSLVLWRPKFIFAPPAARLRVALAWTLTSMVQAAAISWTLALFARELFWFFATDLGLGEFLACVCMLVAGVGSFLGYIPSREVDRRLALSETSAMRLSACLAVCAMTLYISLILVPTAFSDTIGKLSSSILICMLAYATTTPLMPFIFNTLTRRTGEWMGSTVAFTKIAECAGGTASLALAGVLSGYVSRSVLLSSFTLSLLVPALIWLFVTPRLLAAE